MWRRLLSLSLRVRSRVLIGGRIGRRDDGMQERVDRREKRLSHFVHLGSDLRDGALLRFRFVMGSLSTDMGCSSGGLCGASGRLKWGFEYDEG